MIHMMELADKSNKYIFNIFERIEESVPMLRRDMENFLKDWNKASINVKYHKCDFIIQWMGLRADYISQIEFKDEVIEIT